jgi:hypothetical protein
MLISFLHTSVEVLLLFLMLRIAQLKLVKSNPESGGALALSFVLGS